jgi:hypothetical protein
MVLSFYVPADFNRQLEWRHDNSGAESPNWQTSQDIDIQGITVVEQLAIPAPRMSVAPPPPGGRY